MFERFTDRARRVVVLAQEESRASNHSYIGTEQLLAGLIHEGEGVAAVVLIRLGITAEVVRAQIRAIIGFGSVSPTGHIPFTPRCKKVLELSLREALQLGHNYIGTEHVLLGLIREGEGVGCQIIAKSGVELTTVRQAIIQQLSGYQKPPTPRYLRSPVDPTAYVDAWIPGIEVLVNDGWTLVERLITSTTCPDCGQPHQCDRYVEIEVPGTA